MSRSLLSFFLLSAFLLVCSSCQKLGPKAPFSTGVTPVQHTIRTAIIDDEVRNTLLFVNASYKRLKSGHLSIRVNFENRLYTQDVWANISVEFLDENNMIVDKTEWMDVFFRAAQVTMVEGSSISPKATKHVLLMRNLKTSTGRVLGPAKKIYEYR